MPGRTLGEGLEGVALMEEVCHGWVLKFHKPIYSQLARFPLGLWLRGELSAMPAPALLTAPLLPCSLQGWLWTLTLWNQEPQVKRFFL